MQQDLSGSLGRSRKSSWVSVAVQFKLQRVEASLAGEEGSAMGLASSRAKRRRTAIDRVPPRPGGEPGTRWPERVAGDFQTPGPNYGANRRSGFSRRNPHGKKEGTCPGPILGLCPPAPSHTHRADLRRGGQSTKVRLAGTSLRPATRRTTATRGADCLRGATQERHGRVAVDRHQPPTLVVDVNVHCSCGLLACGTRQYAGVCRTATPTRYANPLRQSTTPIHYANPLHGAVIGGAIT